MLGFTRDCQVFKVKYRKTMFIHKFRSLAIYGAGEKKNEFNIFVLQIFFCAVLKVDVELYHTIL